MSDRYPPQVFGGRIGRDWASFVTKYHVTPPRGLDAWESSLSLSSQETRVLDALSGRREAMEASLAQYVGINSYSENAQGSNALGDLIERRLESLGFRTAVMVSGVVGRTIVARREGEGHRLLLLGHLDTVHPPKDDGTGEPLVVEPSGERATGPGCADMKGGLVVMLEAIEALHATGELENRNLSVVINADEEIGSPHSADLIRAEAGEADLALCFEAGRETERGTTTFVTSRRGFGRMRLIAKGRAAHAGVDPSKGASAVLELSHKVIALQALNDPGEGVSVNVGILKGGTAANTIAEHAEIALDYRFGDEDNQLELEDAIFREAAKNIVRLPDGKPGVSTVMRDQVKRPAMERSEAMGRMATRIIDWGQDLGLKLEEEHRGGSSDAALVTEMDTPAVCGMGAVGGDFHAKSEWMRPESLVERAKLCALTALRFYAL